MTSLEFRWERSSKAVLADALLRQGPNRCVAQVRPDEILLTEPPSRRERAGTAALLECGAALSTIWTVVRVLCHEPEVAFPRDPDRPDIAAVVRVGGARTASDGEWARYDALRKLGHGGDLLPVGLAVLGALAAEDFWPDTAVRIVRPDWVATLRRLGADVTGHSSLLITTPGDSRRHHLLAGAALHSTRLAAAVRGLSSQVLPLRAAGESSLPGVPQAVLLVGLATPKRRNS
ncbi:hypothetical protein ACGFMK_25060 [Amycolatopsis sp. NPDC049252]|uniref:hypothetical protein n=1 Tax=Amycolatopsis sp. NPDC049252 TaxID=3363933 RepID=UPI0037157074